MCLVKMAIRGFRAFGVSGMNCMIKSVLVLASSGFRCLGYSVPISRLLVILPRLRNGKA